jgi:hypothetical protein
MVMRRFALGARPARRLPQPEATRIVMGVTKWLSLRILEAYFRCSTVPESSCVRVSFGSKVTVQDEGQLRPDLGDKQT